MGETEYYRAHQQQEHFPRRRGKYNAGGSSEYVPQRQGGTYNAVSEHQRRLGKYNAGGLSENDQVIMKFISVFCELLFVNPFYFIDWSIAFLMVLTVRKYKYNCLRKRKVS